MAIALSTALRNLLADQLAIYISDPNEFRIYSGSMPAHCADAATGTLLATLTINGFTGSASGGVITLDAVTGDSSADASGTAGYWRLMNVAGSSVIMQGNVGAGSGSLSLNTTGIVAGAAVSITSGTITMPES